MTMELVKIDTTWKRSPHCWLECGQCLAHVCGFRGVSIIDASAIWATLGQVAHVVYAVFAFLFGVELAFVFDYE